MANEMILQCNLDDVK